MRSAGRRGRSAIQFAEAGQDGQGAQTHMRARSLKAHELEYRHQETEPADRFVGCYVPQIVAVADTWLLSTDSMCRSPNRP